MRCPPVCTRTVRLASSCNNWQLESVVLGEQRAAAGMGRTRKAHGLEELLEFMEVAKPPRAANPAARQAEQRGDDVGDKQERTQHHALKTTAGAGSADQ